MTWIVEADSQKEAEELLEDVNEKEDLEFDSCNTETVAEEASAQDIRWNDELEVQLMHIKLEKRESTLRSVKQHASRLCNQNFDPYDSLSLTLVSSDGVGYDLLFYRFNKKYPNGTTKRGQWK